MPIETGQMLGHFRLVEKIGEGGMGAVWKAVDTTLNRDVAIKILPDVFAEDPERLARFEREAKVLASLSHPNIAGIYGIHEDDGRRFLAMELIDGEDLAERLARGALDRAEALRIALQIAHAFEAAHESGVVHRDLKPANIKLAANGTVKVLDFGLAKALSADATGDANSASMSPTLTSAGTMAGVILGTAAYMSPEQAKGKPVDRRADIWSFGVVLYEMLTGRRPFQGETVSETLAAVMMIEIDFGALPADTPRRVRRLLERCLNRDPRARLRDIGDARIALEEAIDAPAETAAEAASATRRTAPWLVALPWLVAIAAIVALIAVLGGGDPDRPPAPVTRLELDTTVELAPLLNLPALALSPDGSRLVFVGQGPSSEMLYLRHSQDPEPVPIRGTEGASYPFFSPDGESIGFFQGGQLKKASVLGGPPTTLCDVPRLRGVDWGDAGQIVFTPDRGSGLMLISEAGGTPEPLTTVEEATTDSVSAPSHRWPVFLPGGRAVLFTSTPNNSRYDDARIVAVSLADREQKVLIESGTYPSFIEPDLLLYSRGSTLFAARFDPDRLELKRPGVPVLEGVYSSRFFGNIQLTHSTNGTAVYATGSGGSLDERLVWLDLDGTETPASSHIRTYTTHALSPDGKRMAIEISDADSSDIWLLEFERDTLTRLTFHEFRDSRPVWSPDGEWVYFGSLRGGTAINLFRKRADGTGEAERLTEDSLGNFPHSVSPDGRTLAFTRLGGDSIDIRLLRLDAEPKVESFLEGPFDETNPQISPDGRWIAYQSDESGEAEIYVRPLDGRGGQVKVSTRGGMNPHWSPDGQELYYNTVDWKMMAVRPFVDGDLRPELPRELFDYPSTFSLRFNVAPDGQRLITNKNSEARADERQLMIVLNWFDELQSKVPR